MRRRFRRARRRSLVGIGVWSVAATLAGLFAWHFGWIGIDVADVSFSPAERPVVRGSPDPAQRKTESRTDSFGLPDSTPADADATVFTDQWEPPGTDRTVSPVGPPDEPGKMPSRLASQRGVAAEAGVRGEGRSDSRSTLRRGIGLLPPRRPLPPQQWDEPAAPDLSTDMPMSPEMPELETADFESPAAPASDGAAPVNDGDVVQTVDEVEQTSAGDSNATQRPIRNPGSAGSSGPTDHEQQSSVQPASIRDELKVIDRQLQAGQTVTAHELLSKLYWNRPDQRPAIQERIERTATSIYFSPQPHYMQPYIVQPGDQLRNIAAVYHVPWQYLEKLNRIDARRIRPGQKLKVIKGPFAAVIDLSDFRLTIHHHGYFVRSYPVGIGKDGATPTGTFKVLNKVVNPQYTAPDGTVVAAADPNNPLGERWIDLGDGYGIHGTIEPMSIGRAESRGCIRLSSQDVEEVFDLLTVGSEVLIR